MRRSRLAALAVLSLPALWAACSSFSPADADTLDAGEDAPGESAPPADGGGEADASVPPPETSFTDLKNWESYTLSVEGTSAFLAGGVYATPNVYFSTQAGVIVRYDTTAEFNADGSWASFDIRALPGGPRAVNPGVVGADGLIYFPASFNSTDTLQQASVRLDPRLPFTGAGAWSSFSTRDLTDGGYAPFGAAFAANGRVTFLPYDRTIGGADASMHAPPAVFSFAVNAAFEAASTWAPNTQLFAGAADDPPQFAGAAVVGDYAYAGSATAPQVLRLKTTLDTPAERFSTLGFLPAGSSGVASFGTLTDGRYVYFAPEYAVPNPFTLSGQLVRYDTSKPWANNASFEVFDLASIDVDLAGFLSGTFDGRFLYLVGFTSSKVVRFDTTRSLADHGAYEVLALRAINSNPGSVHNGAVFDGQYVYVAPTFSREVFRFRAKTTRVAWPNQASNF